jgi:uncharacterized membrane protein YkoI
MRSARLHVVAAFLVVALPLVSAATADDQDRAREDVAAGRILPLATIVERATEQFGGTILDAEYECDDDDHGDRNRLPRHRYELKLLTVDGRILELDYDAVTGDLVSERGRRRDHHRWRYGRPNDE